MGMKRTFDERLDEGAFWEAYVASKFTREGFHVLLGPMHRGKWNEFANSIDLQISQGRPGTIQDVEVKGSYPRVQDDLMLVCSESSFDNKAKGKMELYAHFVFASPKTGKLYCVLQGTPIVRGLTHTDSERGKTYNVIKVHKTTCIPWEAFIKAIRR